MLTDFVNKETEQRAKARLSSSQCFSTLSWKTANGHWTGRARTTWRPPYSQRVPYTPHVNTNNALHFGDRIYNNYKKNVDLTGLEGLHEHIQPHQEKTTKPSHFTRQLTQFSNMSQALMGIGEKERFPIKKTQGTNQCIKCLWILLEQQQQKNCNSILTTTGNIWTWRG